MKNIQKPTELLSFGKAMFGKIKESVDKARSIGVEEDKRLSASLKCPTKYNPEQLYSICYGLKGTLYSHQDGQLVSVSRTFSDLLLARSLQCRAGRWVSVSVTHATSSFRTKKMAGINRQCG